MPLVCQFCGEKSVVEEEIEDGREQLVCVECGSVATQTASFPLKLETQEVKPELLDRGDEKPDAVCSTGGVCQSCGEELSPNDGRFCPECQDLEEEEAGCIAEHSNTCAKLITESPTSSKHEIEDAKTPTCLSCGSCDLVVDHLGTDERLVCRSCGLVAGDEQLTNDCPEESSTSTFGNRSRTLPKYSNCPRTELAEGFTYGLDKIKVLQEKLSLPEHIKDHADELFHRAMSEHRLRHVTIVSKVHIGAACVYIACRQHNLPISLCHFKKHVDIISKFTKLTRRIIKMLRIELSQPSLGAQISYLFNSLKIQIHQAEAIKLMSQVRDLMFLCRRAWLTSSFNPEPLILQSIYYVYLNTDLCKGYLSFPKFCKKFKLSESQGVGKYHFRQFLMQLAAGLPWVRPDSIKLSTVHRHINDILRYKNSLLHLAFDTPEPGEECAPWENGGSELMHTQPLKHNKTSPAPLTPATKKGILLPLSFKRHRAEESKCASAQNYDEPEVPAHIDLDCPEIKATDFSEEEISSYILSHNEINNLGPVKEDIFVHRKKRQRKNVSKNGD